MSERRSPDENELAQSEQLPDDPEDGTSVVDDGPRLHTVRALLRGAFQRATTPRQTRSCTTGNRKLDALTGGMRPAITWVLMADTSFGKTSWTIACADQNLKRGARVLIVSVEDAPSMYADRLLARRGNIDAKHVRDGCMTTEEHKAALDVVNRGERAPVYMDAIGKSAEWILRTLPVVIRDHGIDIVFVDYIQEIYAERRFESEQLMLKWVARELRAMFKRLRVSGTIVSQITPSGERPRKENVRQCKDIVQGTEVIAIGYEPERDFETRSAGVIPAGTKCLILEKNKDGPKGVVPLNWDERVATFWDEPDSEYDNIDDLRDRVAQRDDTDDPSEGWWQK